MPPTSTPASSTIRSTSSIACCGGLAFHFHSALWRIHRTSNARQLFASGVLADIRRAQVVTLAGDVNLDRVEKFPAKNLNARDDSIARRKRFLHQRRGINAEVKTVRFHGGA